MRPKKTITPEHQAKMRAALLAAPKKRMDIRISQESKADTLAVLDKLSEEIKEQLEIVKDDVVTIHKMVTALDRAIFRDDWGRVSSISAAIQAFSLNISKRIESCSTQARVANRMLEAIRVNEDD
jgi:hypothetical protein